MKRDHYALLLFLTGVCLLACAPAGATGMPEITAQGFSAEQPQTGIIGEFPRLRVRVEAPGRIKELRIRERSYDVDLATTRDEGNLQLFGLEHSPRSYPDVTLNLQNYINEKIHRDGVYEFHLRVTDRNDNPAEKKISIRVSEAMPAADSSAAQENPALRTGTFNLQRTGTGIVQGAPLFGIDWENIDDAKVAIRITGSGKGDTLFGRLEAPDFATIQDAGQLVARLAGIEKTRDIVLETAGDAAAGRVFSISRADRHHILMVTASSAHPSRPGTVVTLEGQYKSLEPDE